MPPKVEAVILAALLVGAYILMENSHRIDVSPADDARMSQTARVSQTAMVSQTAIPTCQTAQQARRLSMMSAIAAEGEGAAVFSDGAIGEANDGCTATRNYSAAVSEAKSAMP